MKVIPWKNALPDDELLQYYTEVYPDDRERAQRRFEEHIERREGQKTPQRPVKKNQNRQCVVYGLYKNDELVYIGSTLTPKERKNAHKRDKDFDIFRILYKGEESVMRKLEKELIIEEKPVLNVVFNN